MNIVDWALVTAMVGLEGLPGAAILAVIAWCERCSRSGRMALGRSHRQGARSEVSIAVPPRRGVAPHPIRGALTSPAGGVALLAAGVGTGLIARPFNAGTSDIVWMATTLGGLIPIAVRILIGLIRRSFGVDVVALVAMAGCLALGEYLAGSVVALMVGSGQALEAFAQRRARRELSALAGRAPTVAHRRQGGAIADIPLAAVALGDVLIIRPGDVVPVDGTVGETAAVLDESALTGEAMPVTHPPGDRVRSGTLNSGPPFTIVSTATAETSTYSGIIRMVEAAQASRAPLVRLADRYAAVFLAATFGMAALAWTMSGSAVRALAVLVVATPCPLIIAAPVAIVAGISRSAQAGVVVKGGGVLERLGSIRTLLFDKTGTLTSGRPSVREISVLPGFNERDLLRYAASLDQLSSHPLAAALRDSAVQRQIELVMPADVEEAHGTGISGTVAGRTVRVGRSDYAGLDGAGRWEERVRRTAMLESLTPVFVAVDGAAAGALLLGDELRPDSARSVRSLRRAGVERIIMVTGDHPDIGEAIGAAVGLDAVMAERAPDEKAMVVRAEQAAHGPVAFVGDGINDAVALATADVGIAIGSRGASAASESADAVLIVDRLDNIGEAIAVARRSRHIAVESILAGMAMSVVAMIAASFGLLVPVAGAILQEGIDVVVIANALRALGGSRRPRVSAEMSAMSSRLREEHRVLRGGIDDLRRLADTLDGLPADTVSRRIRDTTTFLTEHVLPHEVAEENDFYPLVADHIGGSDPTATMLRAHAEIIHLTRSLERVAAACDGGRLDQADVLELRHLLYSLHAVLSLHNAQEEEAYISLGESSDVEGPACSAKPAARR